MGHYFLDTQYEYHCTTVRQVHDMSKIKHVSVQDLNKRDRGFCLKKRSCFYNSEVPFIANAFWTHNS